MHFQLAKPVLLIGLGEVVAVGKFYSFLSLVKLFYFHVGGKSEAPFV